MAVTLKYKGELKKTRKFLTRSIKEEYLNALDQYGEAGVRALATATPVDTGKTADSWDYRITRTKTGAKIEWTNGNVNEGVNIAVILQYGHGTRNGGYVEGIDYINPAMKPLFDKIAEDAWEEVTKE